MTGVGGLEAMTGAHDVHFFQPCLELGGGAEAQDLPQVVAVVEAGGLVVEHDVIGARDAHDVIAASNAEEGEQGIHVVLIGLGVIGVADVATHRETEHLAAIMILETGADDLFAVVEVFGIDEADYGIDEERLELAGDGIGAGFEGLLVDAVMGIG